MRLKICISISRGANQTRRGKLILGTQSCSTAFETDLCLVPREWDDVLLQKRHFQSMIAKQSLSPRFFHALFVLLYGDNAQETFNVQKTQETFDVQKTQETFNVQKTRTRNV